MSVERRRSGVPETPSQFSTRRSLNPKLEARRPCHRFSERHRQILKGRKSWMHLLLFATGLPLSAGRRTPSFPLSLSRFQHDFTRGPPPHLDEETSSSNEIRYQKRSKGRQALFVGNMNPTTDYTTLRETFKAFPSFAGFRMSEIV